MRLPYAEAVRPIRALQASALRIHLNDLGYRGELPEGLKAGECLYLWLADRLVGDRLVHPAQQSMLLSELLDDFITYGDRLAESVEKREHLPIGILTIANKAFASFSGREGFLNLALGGWVKGLRHYPAVQVVYNLAGVYLEGKHVAKQPAPANGEADAESHSPPAKTPGRPAPVRP